MDIEKEKFKAIKELAETNMLISKAKQSLSELKDIEEKYLSDREKKAIKKIDKIIADSKDVLEEVSKNYQSSNSLHKTALTLADTVIKLYEKVDKTIDLFNKASEKWEKACEIKEKEFEEVRKSIKTQKISIETAERALLAKENEINVKERVVNDRYATLLRTMKR